MTVLLAWGASEPSAPTIARAPSAVRACLAADSAARPRSALARFLGVRPLPPRARVAFSAAVDELTLARVLERLGTEWVCLRQGCVDGNPATFSHLVIGPGGAFTITAANYSASDVWVDDFTLAVDGSRTAGVDIARREAREVSAWLATDRQSAPRVTPIIVIFAAQSITFGSGATKAPVMSADRLVRWLSQRPRVLSASAIAQCRASAERHARRGGGVMIADDTLEQESAFEELQRRVTSARRRLLLCVEVLTIASLALTVGLVLL